ncbi:MAG: hypothetical protein AB1778_02620 [Candidatus Bipolaricaulota bacterium]
MPIAESGDRFPFFEGFASRLEYLVALRRLETFLAELVAAPRDESTRPDERILYDFPSRSALRVACRRLAADLAGVSFEDVCQLGASPIPGRN